MAVGVIGEGSDGTQECLQSNGCDNDTKEYAVDITHKRDPIVKQSERLYGRKVTHRDEESVQVVGCVYVSGLPGVENTEVKSSRTKSWESGREGRKGGVGNIKADHPRLAIRGRGCSGIWPQSAV